MFRRAALGAILAVTVFMLWACTAASVPSQDSASSPGRAHGVLRKIRASAFPTPPNVPPGSGMRGYLFDVAACRRVGPEETPCGLPIIPLGAVVSVFTTGGDLA